MKKNHWKKMRWLFAILMILIANLIGINAIGTEDGTSGFITNTDNPPDGLLIGYRPETLRIKTGEHLEEWGGWVGAPFTHLVVDYEYILCCKKTMRVMDGCRNLKICPN